MTDETVLTIRKSSCSTSMALIHQAVGDRGEAWGRLVRLYAPLVQHWCRERYLQESEVEDVGQRIFIKVFLSLGGFRKDRPGDSFRKWLKTIAVHELNDFGAERLRHPLAEGGTTHQGMIEDLAGERSEAGSVASEVSEWVLLLRRCLDLVREEFTPRTFDAFWGVAMDGKTPAEVAESLGMASVGAVHTAKSRVQRRLRELLDELEGCPP